MKLRDLEFIIPGWQDVMVWDTNHCLLYDSEWYKIKHHYYNVVSIEAGFNRQYQFPYVKLVVEHEGKSK